MTPDCHNDKATSRKLHATLLRVASIAVAAASVAIVWGAAEQQRPSREQLARSIREILARPEYREAKMGLIRRVLEAIADWLLWLLDRLFLPSLSRLFETRPVLYWLIVISLFAAVALLLYHLVATAVYAFRERRPATRPARDEAAIDPRALRDRAMQFARDGKYDRALRMFFRALIAFLDRKDMLRVDDSLTNWEYAAAVSADSGLKPHMRELAALLDPVWYGGHTCDKRDYEAGSRSMQQIWQLAEGAE